jgi:hypothetical protein
MSERRGKLTLISPHVPDRVLIMGDIHGDLGAFRRAVCLVGSRDVAVFLGDYADRGPDGAEVLEALMALTRRSPDRFIALKGNHEDYSNDGEPLFEPCTLRTEIGRKGHRWADYFPQLKSFLDTLPIAALLPGYALCVHGGISNDIGAAADLERPSPRLESEVIWSDPGRARGRHRNPRGAGVVFGPDVSQSVLARLGVRHLFRSHEPRKAMGGPAVEHDGRVVTTSCTGVYGGRPFAVVLPTSDLPETSRALLDCVEFL